MAKKLTLNISSPLLYIILGIILVIYDASLISTIAMALGVIFIILGIIDVIRRRVTIGIINVVIGILLWTVLPLVIDLFWIVLGVIIAANGVIHLIGILNRKKKNLLLIIFAALTIAFGVALAFGNLLGTLIDVIGIFLIIDGAVSLLGIKK